MQDIGIAIEIAKGQTKNAKFANVAVSHSGWNVTNVVFEFTECASRTFSMKRTTVETWSPKEKYDVCREASDMNWRQQQGRINHDRVHVNLSPHHFTLMNDS